MFDKPLTFLPVVYPKAKAMGITDFPYKEYDSNGNETYVETSDGYWYKKEYDANGNRTYYENSDGIIERYDANGNII